MRAPTRPARITTIHACMNSLTLITICVGPGSAPPNSANIFWKTGITFTSSTTTTALATTSTVIGYTMAPFTLRARASAFSR